MVDGDHQADSFALASGRALVRRTFHIWKSAEHGKLLLHARKSRILRRALIVWRHRINNQAVVQLQRADAFRADRLILHARSALYAWRARLASRDKSFHLAASLSNRLLLQQSLQNWRKGQSVHRLEARKACVAADFFVQRSCLHVWLKGTRQRKAAAWAEDRRKLVLRDVFDTWRAGARRSIRDFALVRGIGSAINQRVMLVALRTWTNRVIDIKARNLSVSAERSTVLVSEAFSRWRRLTVRHVEDLSLVDSFVEVQDEQLGKRYFRQWLVRLRRDRGLKDLLAVKLSEDKQNLLAGCFERWADRFRESQLVHEVGWGHIT